MRIIHLRCATLMCLAMGVAAAQQPARTNLRGSVQAIEANGQITLHTGDGKTVAVTPHEGAKLLRVLPGQKPTDGTPITASEIAVGDLVVVRGELSADQASLAASTILVMSPADVAKKHQADQAEWRKRGVGGLVTAVDVKAGEVTITTRTAEGVKPLIVVAGAKTTVKRYAQDSAKSADARPGTLADIKPGDQVQALGTKSEDGTHYDAEELFSGSFRNVAATVTAVDLPGNTVKVMDLATKKPLLVHVNADSTLRKLPEMVAKGIAMRTSGGGSGGAPGGGAGGNWPGAGGGAQRPQGTPGGAAGAPGGGAAPGGPGGMRSARGGDMQQMLQYMPAIKLDDLKQGDAIIVSSVAGADPGQVTAITLVAGVEPILSAVPGGSQRASMLGSWNLDMNAGGGMQ